MSLDNNIILALKSFPKMDITVKRKPAEKVEKMTSVTEL